MDDAIISVENLKQAWRDLSAGVRRDKKIKFEMFESAFSQTYALLSKHLTESCLEKKYIELISEAFLFANIKDETLDHVCTAAFVLTERMLSCCAFGNAPVSNESAAVYFVESRREIILHFNDVSESISKLVNSFESMSWKKVNL